MLFYSFFKSLVGKDVVVELKNDLSICGTLHSVDQVSVKQGDSREGDSDGVPDVWDDCSTVGEAVECEDDVEDDSGGEDAKKAGVTGDC